MVVTSQQSVVSLQMQIPAKCLYHANIILFHTVCAVSVLLGKRLKMLTYPLIL